MYINIITGIHSFIGTFTHVINIYCTPRLWNKADKYCCPQRLCMELIQIILAFDHAELEIILKDVPLGSFRNGSASEIQLG